MLTTTTSGGGATGPRSANSHLSPNSSSSRTPRLAGRSNIPSAPTKRPSRMLLRSLTSADCSATALSPLVRTSRGHGSSAERAGHEIFSGRLVRAQRPHAIAVGDRERHAVTKHEPRARERRHALGAGDDAHEV